MAFTDLSPLDVLAPFTMSDQTAAKVVGAVSAANDAVGAVTPGSNLLGGSLTKYVMILLGLLFIAAGIFSFDKAREIVVNTAKAGAHAAAAA